MITLKENYNHFFGSMVSNPFEGADSSALINIEQGVFVPNDPPGVYVVENMAHYDGVLLSVHFLHDEWSTVEGYAVMIAPGIAFAAAHVIEPLMPHIMASELRIFCVGYTPFGPRYWRVGQVTKLNNSDIMILALKFASALPPDGRFVQTMITTRLPGVGEKVMVAGIRDALIAFMAATAQAQAEATKEAQRAGIAHAKANGDARAYKGRKPSYSRKQFESAQAMLGKSASVGEVARTTGLTRQTIYRIKDDPVGAEAALATWGM